MLDLEDFKHPIIVPVTYIEPKHVFSLLGRDTFVYLGGSGRYHVLALDIEKASWDTFLSQKFDEHPREHDLSVFHLGFIGALPYSKVGECPSHGPLFLIRASMVWDTWTRKCSLVFSRTLENSKWRRILGLVENLKRVANERRQGFKVNLIDESMQLISQDADADYLKKVEESIEDIRSGRFYQINLLRYFDVANPVQDDAVFNRVLQNGGPHTAFIQDHHLRLVSFSPERFIRMECVDGENYVSMQPIKGTYARNGHDSDEIDTLRNSAKDLSELNIIVDLARNDLQSICQAGTVQVKSSSKIESFPTVHHLVADIQGNLKSGMNFREIFEGILPAASITGAPKLEVTQAIFEREGRDRNFYMGQIFYWDPGSAIFDSSVLIRTMVGELQNENWRYEYAAGSGIVVGSESEIELTEINTKTRVLTSPLIT